MHLAEYLQSQRITPAEFARRLGADRSTVHRYLLPQTDPKARMPQPEAMKKITRLTRGKVRPEDFYSGLYPKGRRKARAKS